jgi:ankyrin repeat protein
MIASVGGYEDVVKLLLNKGADPNSMNKDGMTPLHEAAKDSQAIGIIKALIAAGADPNIRVAHPNPSKDGVIINQGSYGGAQASSGVSYQGATPLLMAAEQTNLEAVKVLIESGADPFLATDQNVTALMMAAGGGTGLANTPAVEPPLAVEIVKYLHELGGDLNTVGQFGWTPLHVASYHGYNNAIDYLLKNGANPNVFDGFGQTPLSISYAIVTEGIGDAYTQTPRSFRRATADLLLSQGALPLEESGVKIVSQRAAE